MENSVATAFFVRGRENHDSVAAFLPALHARERGYC